MSKHGVGSELGELGRPKTDSQDSLSRNPVGVDVGERLASGDTGFALERTDQDSVGAEQVIDGGTLGKELCLSAEWALNHHRYLPGLDKMSKVHPGFELASRMVRMALP